MQEQVNNAMESAKGAAATVGERVSDFFQGNPFSTPCGRKIEMATDASVLVSENWGLNMEICDFINSTAEGGRDAMRAIRKRLHTQMSRNNAAVMYTLTVLETCVKNCDVRFHELVCQKDFINDLIRFIGPKFDAPQIIQERVLSLIQSWNNAFHGDPRLQGVCQIYDELKAKGVEFPMTDLDNMAPIITPKRTVYLDSGQTMETDCCNMTQAGETFVGSSQQVIPTAEQLDKLRKELDVVANNLKVFREMLSDLEPSKEDDADLQLLHDLNDMCRQMQYRILDLIRSVVSEDVTCELLILNDELNNAFEKYARYMSHRESSNSSRSRGQEISSQIESLKIDENRSHRLETTYAENSTGMDQSNIAISAAAFNKTFSISDREAAEMKEWLEAQEAKGHGKDNSNDPATEFDPLLIKKEKDEGL